jgi:hypothetical protein
MKKLAALLLVYGLMAPNVSATLISVSEQAEITESGQLFSFEFDNLIDNNGAVGTLTFGASGDYDGSQINEVAYVSLGSLGSFIMNATGLISNGINGLTLASFTTATVTANIDSTFEAVFDVDASLLSNLVLTGTLNVSIQNDQNVAGFDGLNPDDLDYVMFNLSYDSIEPLSVSVASVSGPSVSIMMLFALVLLFNVRRY